ncbi:hypothetical protein Lal_00050247 [Lupinus albus]|uniref:Putative transcription factor C2H2 family n=1 Tax=Lupinus albus TaxID=3870 RepID=A0A6A5M6T7_LUPAL|nr:putative transcription factor C2H2 family [Lupinus albus]KAF1867813.1 hypothetical protein Lal_00050247 [Lupinus albus]
MVWFQCEDCGDNLKKPKLVGHFRSCSAYKLSCIDCGEIFGQDTVQNHTQCITEAEKYGPKGQGKTSNVTPSKPNNDKQKPEVDINVGLSQRPPWFCSLCNTKATSQQTLLLHADGKKHRARARAVHASKQQAAQADKATTDAKITVETATNGEVRDGKNADQAKLQESSKQDNLKPENEISSENKKRKFNVSEAGLVKKSRNGNSVDNENGQVIQGEGAEAAKGDTNKIKWKKFIKSALKSHPDGILKLKKLRKVVHKALQESDIVVDESELSKALQQKIDSSSRFAVEGKYVRLVA